MKEYEQCAVCSKPVIDNNSNLQTFQVCSQHCLEELTGLIWPGTSPGMHNAYKEKVEK